MSTRYDKLKATLCPSCPLRTTCSQFPEQLDACADAEAIQQEDLLELRIQEDQEWEPEAEEWDALV